MFRPEQSSLNKIISRDSFLLKRQTWHEVERQSTHLYSGTSGKAAEAVASLHCTHWRLNVCGGECVHATDIFRVTPIQKHPDLLTCTPKQVSPLQEHGKANPDIFPGKS